MRQCGWCTSLNRQALEARVLGGESVSSVAIDTPYSVSAGNRHFRNHVQAYAEVVIRREEASQLQLASFAGRLLGLADEAASIREDALAAGNHRVALWGIREERESLSTLMQRLGVDEQDTIAALREARVLSRALSVVLSTEPATARALAGHLSRNGEVDLAAAFGRLAEYGEANAHQVTQLHQPREVAS